MASHDDFAVEPVEGLPERLPRGEAIVWQGRPDSWALARDAYKLRWIVGYLVILALWKAAGGWADGGLARAIAVLIPYLALAAVAGGILYTLAAAQARATRYTITTARVVLRIGAALSVTFNLPFRQIGAAALDKRADGTGTIALQTTGTTRIAYLVAWPHVRPWRLRQPEPALRSVPDAEVVAGILAEAVEARMAEDGPILAGPAAARTGVRPASAVAPAGAVTA